MMLTIAILSALLYMRDIMHIFSEGKSSLLFSGAILTISTWNCLPLAIIIMVLTVIMIIIGTVYNMNK